MLPPSPENGRWKELSSFSLSISLSLSVSFGFLVCVNVICATSRNVSICSWVSISCSQSYWTCWRLQVLIECPFCFHYVFPSTVLMKIHLIRLQVSCSCRRGGGQRMRNWTISSTVSGSVTVYFFGVGIRIRWGNIGRLIANHLQSHQSGGGAGLFLHSSALLKPTLTSLFFGPCPSY